MGWDRAEEANMGVHGVGVATACGGVNAGDNGPGWRVGAWVGVLGAVHDMMVCAAEVERAAKAVQEAESVVEAVVEASTYFQFLEALSICSDHIDEIGGVAGSVPIVGAGLQGCPAPSITRVMCGNLKPKLLLHPESEQPMQS